IELEAFTRQKIFELARQTIERPDFLIPIPGNDDSIPSGQAALTKAFAEVKQTIQHCCDAQDKLFLLLSNLITELAKTETFSSEWESFFDLHNRLLPVIQTKGDSIISTKTKGAAKNWSGRIDEARNNATELFLALQQLHTAYANRLVSQWYEPLQELRTIHQELLRKNGEARFDDFIEGAIAFLSEPQHPGNSIGEFLHLDEAQDTDPRQTIFIERMLTRATSEHASLFAVGDVKQSIYLFRNADVTQFAERLRGLLLAANPEAVQYLTANFRSTPGIVQFVNELFRELFPDEYVAMEAVVTASNPPSLVIIDGEYPSRAKMEDMDADSAAAVAGYLAQCRERGELPRTADGEIAWNEIAILLTNSSKATFYESALRQHHTPYLNETPRGFFTTDIIADIANALAVIANPYDGIGLLGALRGSLFAISDRDLWDWQQALQAASESATLHLMPAPAGVSPTLANALHGLWQLHCEASTLPLAAIVQKLYRQAHLIERTWYDGGGAAVRGKLEGILTAARRMPAVTTVSEFAEWLRAGRSEPSREAQFIFPEEPAVRLLTVHGAKGLEFEWVIVHGAGNWGESRRNNATGMVHTNNNGEVELGFQKWFRTNGFAEAAAEQLAKEAAEQRRLLYVACTRAKRRLILPTLEKSRKTPRDFSYRTSIREAAQTLSPDEVQLLAVTDCITQPTPPIEAALPDASILPPEPYSTIEIRAISSFHEPIPSDAYEKNADVSGESRETGQSFGSYLHKILAVVPFDADTDTVTAIASKLLPEFSLPEDGKQDFLTKAIEYTERFLHSEFAQSFSTATMFEREYPILSQTADGQCLLVGTIDLLVKTSDRWLVVDYKSDKVNSPELLLSQYSNQVQLYCKVVQRLTNEIVDGFMWHLPSSTLIPVPIL
ncbi:MAG: UvrD-helicase domain-containing protein, partial [bacterium]|nr:UvrD-helicase domain-containing protein [bacterium]